MNIGIEINDFNNKGKDFTHLELGNPGIGGIENQMLLIGVTLKKYFPDDYNIFYYHFEKSNIYPENCEEILCENHLDTLRKVSGSKHKIDVLITSCNKTDEWYDLLRSLDINVWLRIGCYIDWRETYQVRRTSQIVRIQCVCKEEYDYYIDEDISGRMVVIENMLFKDSCQIRNENASGSKKVAYIGSLVPQKGFHLLARIWPEILKKIPDAQLHVLGSGKLYNSDQKLGKYKIASEQYEKSFMPYLTDHNGTLLPGIVFHGSVSGSKNEILQDVSVGVANPSAQTETFCTAAMDFSVSGIPVVTCGKHGLPGTVLNNRTGLNFLTMRKFKKNVMRLLCDDSLNDRLGKNGRNFAFNFDQSEIVKKWRVELNLLQENKPCVQLKPAENWLNDRKWLKLISRFFRFGLHLKFLPSVLQFEAFLWKCCHFGMNIVRKISGTK